MTDEVQQTFTQDEPPEGGIRIEVVYPDPGKTIEFRLGDKHYIQDATGACVVGPCKVIFTMPEFGTEDDDVEVSVCDLTEEDAFQVFAEVYGLRVGVADVPGSDPPEKVNVMIVKLEDKERGSLFHVLLPFEQVTKLQGFFAQGAKIVANAQGPQAPKLVAPPPGFDPKKMRQ